MKAKPSPFHSVPSFLAAAFIGLGGSAFAASVTWNSDLGDPYVGLWTDTSIDGWNGGPPAGGDTALIDNGTVSATANNQQSGVALTIGSAGVLNDGGNYFYFAGTGSSLTLDSGTINVSHVGNGAYRSGGLGATVTANSGSSSINNNGANLGLALDIGGTTFTGDGDLNISIGLDNYFGNVAAGITKSGAGTLTLSGGNTFSGATTVNDGTLALAGGGLLASSSGLIVNGGTVSLQADNSLGTAVTLNGGVMTMSDNWSVNLGAVTLNGGDLSSSGYFNGTYGSYYLNSDINVGAGTSTISAVNITSGGVRTFTVADGGTLNVTGSFSNVYGSFGLTKEGNGTMTLSGANTFAGATTVNAGVLGLGDGGGNLNTILSDSTAVEIASGAQINLDFTGTEVVASLSLNGSDAGTGFFDATSHPAYFTGSGKLFVSGGGIADNDGVWAASTDDFWEIAGNWDSNTIASGADQTATFNGALGTNVNLLGDLTIGSLNFSVEDYTIADTNKLLTLDAATPTITVAADRTATINSRLTSTAEIVKTGDGTLLLNGRNESTAGMAVNAGTLVLARVNDNLSPSSSLTINNGGTVLLANINPMGAPNVTPVTINSGGLMTMSDNWSVNLGSLTLDGGELSSNGFFDGTYGSYFLRDDVIVDATSTISAVKVTAPEARAFDVAAGGTLNVTGSFSSLYGSFGLIKAGDGAMVLSGANDYIGDTWVDAGSLEITDTGSLRCKLTGTANNIVTSSGLGTLAFNGALDFDLSTADLTDGNNWTVIEVGFFSAAPSFGSTFSVTSNAGAFDETSPGSGIWELVDGNNTWTFTESSGELSLAVTSGDPFLSWIDASWPSLSDKTPTGDPDDDGIENILEYVLLGGDPSVSNPAILPTLDASGANFVFSFTRRTASTTDTTQAFQYGNNLSGWTDVPVADGTYGDVIVSVSAVGDNDEIVITVPKGVNNKLFGRLKVSKP